MKKLLTFAFAAIALFALAACNTAPTADTFAAPEDIIGFEAISATELLAGTLASAVDVAQPLAFALLDETTTETPTDDADTAVDDELVDIDKYLAMIEQFLGNTNGLSVTVASSDLPEYTYKMTYLTKDILGNDVTYVLYYTEVLYEEPIDDGETTATTTTGEPVTTTEAETTAEPETTTEPETSEETTTTAPLAYENRKQDEDKLRDHDFEFDDEEDATVKYALTGMLQIGETTFFLEGKKLVNDDQEIMMLRSFVDHDNYVKVRYQTEAGEKKFFYEIVTAGVVVNKSKIKVDIEDGTVKVKLSFIEGEANGTYQFRLETVENVTYIRVKYDVEDADGVEESGNISITATYDELTDTTTYTYIVNPQYRNGHQIENQHAHEFHTNHGNHGGNDHGDGGDGGHRGANV